jgi:hypothetical protein
MAVVARTLNEGDYIRSPSDPSKIYQIREKRGETSILCWRVDSVTRDSMENDFIFIRGEDRVDQASL